MGDYPRDQTARQEPVAARGRVAPPDRSGLCPRGCGATSESIAFAAPTAGARWRVSRRGSRFFRRAQSVRERPGERGIALAPRGAIADGFATGQIRLAAPSRTLPTGVSLHCRAVWRVTTLHDACPAGSTRPRATEAGLPARPGATSESTAFAAPTAGARLRAEAVRGEDFSGSAQSVRDRPGERGNALAPRRGDRGRICRGSNPSGVGVATWFRAGFGFTVAQGVTRPA